MGPSTPRAPEGRVGPSSAPRALPLGLPHAAHRKRDISDAAHGVAVVARVDRAGEDLMQMHVRGPGWPAARTRGSGSLAPRRPPAAKALPRRLPRDAPRGGSGSAPRPPSALPPPRPCHASCPTAAAAAARTAAARPRKGPDAAAAGSSRARLREEGAGAGAGAGRTGRSARRSWAARARPPGGVRRPRGRARVKPSSCR